MSVRKQGNKYRAYIQIHLGSHDTYEQAEQAVKDYRKENGMPEIPVKGRPKKKSEK